MASYVGALAVNLNANSSNFVAGMAGAENALNKFALKATAIKVAMEVFEGVKEIVRLAAEFQLVSVELEVLTGSATEAKKMIEELYQLGLESPFGAHQFLQSAKILGQYGVSLSETTEIVKNLGDIALGDADKLYRMTVAFGQMSASGRLVGQDLLQMVNAGMNPLFYISRRTGESLQQLRLRMEAGKITVREVTQAFKDATAEGGRFAGATAKINATITGQWLEFKEQLEKIGRTLGAFLLPGLTKVLKVTNELATNMDLAASSVLKMSAGTVFFTGMSIAIWAVVYATYALIAALYRLGVELLKVQARGSIAGWISLAISLGASALITAYFASELEAAAAEARRLEEEAAKLGATTGTAGTSVENWTQHWIDAAEALVAAGVLTRNTTASVQELENAAGSSVSVFKALADAYANISKNGFMLASDLKAIQEALDKGPSGVNIYRTMAQQLGITFVELGQRIIDGKITIQDYENALKSLTQQQLNFNTAAAFGASIDPIAEQVNMFTNPTANAAEFYDAVKRGQEQLVLMGSQVSIFEVFQNQLGLTLAQVHERLTAGTITYDQYAAAINEVMRQRRGLGEGGGEVPDLEIKSKGLLEAEKLLEDLRKAALGAAGANAELVESFGKVLEAETDMMRVDIFDAMDAYAESLSGFTDAMQEAEDENRILNGLITERGLMLERMAQTGVPQARIDELENLWEQNDAIREANRLKSEPARVAGAAVKGSTEAHTLKVQQFLRDQGQGQQAVWVAIRQNGNLANQHLARIANRPPQVEFIPIGAVA